MRNYLKQGYDHKLSGKTTSTLTRHCSRTSLRCAVLVISGGSAAAPPRNARTSSRTAARCPGDRPSEPDERDSPDRRSKAWRSSRTSASHRFRRLSGSCRVNRLVLICQSGDKDNRYRTRTEAKVEACWNCAYVTLKVHFLDLKRQIS